MKLIHKLTGQVGEFVREYHRNHYGQTTLIKLADGREYFAPSNEFAEYRLITSNDLKEPAGNLGLNSTEVFPFGYLEDKIKDEAFRQFKEQLKLR